MLSKIKKIPPCSYKNQRCVWCAHYQIHPSGEIESLDSNPCVPLGQHRKSGVDRRSECACTRRTTKNCTCLESSSFAPSDRAVRTRNENRDAKTHVRRVVRHPQQPLRWLCSGRRPSAAGPLAFPGRWARWGTCGPRRPTANWLARTTRAYRAPSAWSRWRPWPPPRRPPAAGLWRAAEPSADQTCWTRTTAECSRHASTAAGTSAPPRSTSLCTWNADMH